MKTPIEREKLFDPKLRAFVARREYIEAMRYYRAQHRADRAEASEAIDFVREQLEKERDSGAAPPTIAVWSHVPSAPQQASAHVHFEAPPPADDTEEESEPSEYSSDAQEELNEEYDDPDENINSSPYELPGTFGRPEAEPANQPKDTTEDPEEDDEIEPNGDEEDDLFDEDEELEELEDEDEDEQEESEIEEEAVIEEEATPAAPVTATREEELPAPVSEAPREEPVRAPIELPKVTISVADEPPVGLPAWESLPSSLQRELLSMELQDAIRLYWSEVGCSLSEAKAYVSYWLSRHR